MTRKPRQYGLLPPSLRGDSMPVAFPQKPRGSPQIQAKFLTTRTNPPGFVPAPNLNNPGVKFTSDSLGSGFGKNPLRPVTRNPGVNFALAYRMTDIEARPQIFTDAALWKREKGTLNMILAYSSLDSTGADLGNCRVMIFRTEDMSFVGETTSDANGDWSISMMKGGPFFFVEYKAGAPDRAGTSLNTLVPTQA